MRYNNYTIIHNRKTYKRIHFLQEKNINEYVGARFSTNNNINNRLLLFKIKNKLLFKINCTP